MKRVVANIVLSLALITLQTTLVRFISLEGITPDLLIIWVVYLSINEGQVRGTIWGFCIGLFMDILSGTFLGLSALTKTIAGFVGGYFHNENKTRITLGSYRFVLIVLLAAFVHNIVYFVLFTQGSSIQFWRAVLYLGLATSLYTVVLSVIPMLTVARKSTPQ